MNHLGISACRSSATYHWNFFFPLRQANKVAKALFSLPSPERSVFTKLTRNKNLLETSPQLEVYKRSYGPPKCKESQFWEFWDSQLGNPKTKWHLNVAPMANCRNFYKGEGNDFPQVWIVVSLMSSCMLVACMCTKSALTTH